MSLDSCTADSISANLSADVESKICFIPPLYRQRYYKVFQILEPENVTSIADFGCSECHALRNLRQLESVEYLVGVDIDRPTLERSIGCLQPLMFDYICKRPRPLKIQVFNGNMLQFDERLAGIEAVTMIEVIEHLNLDDLELLPAALFGTLQPRIVIITTPNAEFNVLFPNFVGFRHADHKFEWTRLQFSDWCNNVADEYGYSVEYDGVGFPPADRGSLGCCSQVAIFHRLSAVSEPSGLLPLADQPYELVGEVVYPVVNKTTTVSEDLLNDAIFYMNFIARNTDEEENGDCSYTRNRSIKLEDLKLYSQLALEMSDYLEKLRQVLRDAGYELTADGLSVLFPNVDDNWSDDDSDDFCNENVVESDCSALLPSSKSTSSVKEEEEDWD